MVIASAEVLLCPRCFSILGEGDWAVYSVNAVWHTDAKGEDVQKNIEYYENIDDTNWTLTIQKFVYPEAMISIVKPLKNATFLHENYGGNIETGYPNLSMWIISPNLSEGELIYKSENNTQSIEAMCQKEFAQATREVIYANFSQSISGVISHFGLFWDRETGILCGTSSILEYYDEDFKLVLIAKVDIEIVETNLWIKATPGLGFIWPVTVTLIVLLSILVVMVMLRRKRKRKSKVSLRRK